MWQLYKAIRQILVFAVGSTVLSIGIVLLFTPGPAFVVIPVGLAILAVEFAWARRWLRRIKLQARQTIRRLNHTRNSLRSSATPARQDGKP